MTDSLPKEFVLTGRFWASVVVGLICALAAVALHLTRSTPWVGLSGWAWKAAGISYQNRQDLYTIGFAALSALCLLWILGGNLVARRLEVSTDTVLISRFRAFRRLSIVIPFIDIRDLEYRESTAKVGVENKYLHFSWERQEFNFRRLSFKSDQEFDRFCAVVFQRSSRPDLGHK